MALFHHTGTYLRYDDELTVPIIENTCHESELTDAMARAMDDYPECPAVLVRRHGLYVWGPTWQKTKCMYVHRKLKCPFPYVVLINIAGYN